MGRLLFFLLPALVSCQIIVNIRKFSNFSDIYFCENVTSILSDKEKRSFLFTDQVLKSSAKENFGTTPDQVFIHDPTPWGHSYKELKWPEVKRTVSLLRFEVICFEDEEFKLDSKIIKRRNKEKIFVSSDKHSLQDVSIVKWYSRLPLDIDEEISYRLSDQYIFKSTWGQKYENKTDVHIRKGVKLSLKRRQVAEVSLYVRKVKVKAIIRYEVNVRGVVLCNYAEKLNGYNFWPHGINQVMSSVGFLDYSKVSQIVSFQHYSEGHVVVKDVVTQETLFYDG